MKPAVKPVSEISPWSRIACWSLIFFLFLTPHLQIQYFVDNFTIIKWCAVYFASGFAVLVLLFEKKFSIPTGKLFWVAMAVVLSRIVSWAWNPNSVSAFNTFDSMVFVFLVLALMMAFERKVFSFENLFWIFMASTVVLAARSFSDLVQCRLMAGNPDPVCFSMPFGNINMISEYLLLTLPFLVYFIRTFTGWKSHLSGVLLAVLHLIIITGYSRSALIGLGIFWAYTFFRGISRRELLYGLLGVGLFLITLGFETHGIDYAKAKDGSFEKRMQLYQGSSMMLLDSPLGVGGGGYEYGYIPFQMATGEHPSELEIYRTPHDEFLKWGIESGWLFLLSQVFWWLLLLILAWRSSIPLEVKYFSISSLLALAPQIVFQFPFDNATSFFMIAFVLALILAHLELRTISYHWLGRLPLALITTLCLWVAVTFSISHYADSSQAGQLEKVTFGCQIFPANWRACNSQGVIQVLSAYPNDALPVIKAELRQRPFQFVALRLLALTQLKANDHLGGCQLGRIYDSFFFGKSLWTDFLKVQCPDVQSPLKYENGSQYKRDYQQFLQKFIK